MECEQGVAEPRVPDQGFEAEISLYQNGLSRERCALWSGIDHYGRRASNNLSVSCSPCGPLGVSFMAQIFHPSMNILARVTIFGAMFIATGAAWACGIFVRSSYVTQVDVVREQPVPFSHQHHVSELGLDCRYCHTSVETSAFAGMPATEVCMGCHSHVWKDSDVLEPVRASLRSGKPLRWTRVHDLPDFVYFNHSIHVAKGIGCESCHGRVDEMPLMRRVAALHMEWCVNCHRHPEVAVRERSEMYQFGLHSAERSRISTEPPIRTTGGLHGPAINKAGVDGKATYETVHSQRPNSSTGRQLVQRYHIATKQLTDCVVCHR